MLLVLLGAGWCFHDRRESQSQRGNDQSYCGIASKRETDADGLRYPNTSQ